MLYEKKTFRLVRLRSEHCIELEGHGYQPGGECGKILSIPTTWPETFLRIRRPYA